MIVLRSPLWSNSSSPYINNSVFSKVDVLPLRHLECETVTVSSHRQKGLGPHAQITLCKFGLGRAFYRGSLTHVCVFMFKCDCQDLCHDVFNGVARKVQCLLAIAAALCAVTVSSHRQQGLGQHAQITRRRGESFFNP